MEHEYVSPGLMSVGRTLIRFAAGQTGQAVVPARVKTIPLERVGSGSVVAPAAVRVEVEEGIAALNQRSFCCDKLEQLILPATLQSAEAPLSATERGISTIVLRRRLSLDSCSQLLQHSFPLADGMHLLPGEQWNLPGLAPLDTLASSACDARLRQVEPSMRLFFCTAQAGKEINSEESRSLLFSRTPCLDLRAQLAKAEEYAVVMEMIRKGLYGYRHAEAERRSDLQIRHRKPLPQERKPLAVVTFSDPSELTISSRYLFVPSLFPIRMNDEDWFLYRRLHLTGDADCPYQREDVGVFSRSGIVTGRDVSNAVYAKARMIMCL